MVEQAFFFKTLFYKEYVMKFSAKSIALGLVVSSMSLTAMADPIIGTWQTYEDGKPKAHVQISKSGSTFTGKVIAGNTDKAKTYVGRTVITGLKADGGGKYSGGSITDPVTGKTYKLSATQTGSSLALRGYVGVKALGRTQTWQKIK